MTEVQATTTGTHDWATVVAIGAIAGATTVGLHEFAHAATCVAFADLEVFSALHVGCSPASDGQERVIAASGALLNFAIGAVSLVMLRRSHQGSGTNRWLWWVLTFTNLAFGFGYFMFSGIGGTGDYARVIQDWNPAGLFRIGLAVIGTAGFGAVAWLATSQLGKIVGGQAEGDHVKRAVPLCAVTYLVFVVMVVAAALLNAEGVTGEPAVVGVIAATFAMSPLFWIPHFLGAKFFIKEMRPSLVVERDVAVLVAAGIAFMIYVPLLGPSLPL